MGPEEAGGAPEDTGTVTAVSLSQIGEILGEDEAGGIPDDAGTVGGAVEGADTGGEPEDPGTLTGPEEAGGAPEEIGTVTAVSLKLDWGVTGS
jgi:hypothetical protein